jgi:SIT4-associating protein SAP185/190
LRLAQRKAQLESTREQEDDPESPEANAGKTQEQEEREGHQRFARMFEGIEDSSDDESINSYEEGAGDDEEGRIEVEGKEIGRRGSTDKVKKEEDVGKEGGSNIVV